MVGSIVAVDAYFTYIAYHNWKMEAYSQEAINFKKEQEVELEKYALSGLGIEMPTFLKQSETQ